MAVTARKYNPCTKHPEGDLYANGSCGQCGRDRDKKWRASDKAKASVAARSKKYKEANPEKVKANARMRMQKMRENFTEEERAAYRAKNAGRRREWYHNKDGKQKAKDLALRQKYGITLLEFERMASDQGGQCGICAGTLDLGFYTAVDHCHDTGAVRGLLCSSCNMALGAFNDNTAMLGKAISYLERYS